MKFYILLLLTALSSATAYAQNDTTVVRTEEPTPDFSDNHEIYKLKPAVDIPITAVGTIWSAYAFTKIYSKDPSTRQQIEALRKEDINGFDRWGADVYSEKAATTSDLFFYGSMPLPLVLMLDKDIRQDAGKVGFLYLQAMSVTGLLYTGSTYAFDRYRPLAYNTSGDVTPEEKMRGGSKNSFFAGHVALVGTATFFTAKVFADYNPTSKLRHLLYGAAVVSTVGTGYLRHRGGKHFPSDIVIGTTVGTLSGLLVPHFHKNPLLKNSSLSVLPFTTGKAHGLSMTYKL